VTRQETLIIVPVVPGKMIVRSADRVLFAHLRDPLFEPAVVAARTTGSRISEGPLVSPLCPDSGGAAGVFRGIPILGGGALEAGAIREFMLRVGRAKCRPGQVHFVLREAPPGGRRQAAGRPVLFAPPPGSLRVDLARMGSPNAEVARVQVGTDDPNGQTRPFTLAWTPDGREIIVANYRSNNVSIVDIKRALAHDPKAEVARIPVIRPPEADGTVLPGNPKGTAVTANGQYAVVSGGPRLDPNAPPSGTVWIINLRSRAVVATVTGVGNDPYGLTMLE